MLLSFALIALACLIVAYPPSELEQSLSAFLDSVPDWLQPLWGFLYDLPWLWAGVLLAMAIGARRWGIVLQSLAALVLGALVAIVAARPATGNWPDLTDAVLGRTGASAFPAVRPGETAAVIVTVAGHLVLPLERTGRWILGLGAIPPASRVDGERRDRRRRERPPSVRPLARPARRHHPRRPLPDVPHRLVCGRRTGSAA